MPVQGLGPQFEFASWRVAQIPRAIEYPLEVMEEIRAFACDELLQLSHGGDEVGGVLFGTRREDLIRILTWRPIACEHTQGPVLRLSYNDRMNLAVQLEMARQNPDLKDLRPVGWFVSHPRADVCLSSSDLEIYNGFFPESWQVALVICPKSNGCAEAGYFVREADGKLHTEASYRCFALEPLRLPPVAAEAAPPELEAGVWERAKSTEPALSQPLRAAAAIQPQPSSPITRIEPARRELPAAEIPADAFPSPSFEIEERLPTHERWLWAIPIVLALGIAAFMLYQRRAPSSNASVGLRALSEAQTVELMWDSNSGAVRDADHAEVQIDDGGKSSHVSLTSDQLHAGKMSYLRQSGDVGFTMTVYPANGDPIHDATRLIAPWSGAPTQPPQLLAPSTAPASTPPPPGADHDALQQQIQQLKADLGKERAHTEELQNLVRILENRLGIPQDATKTGRRR